MKLDFREWPARRIAFMRHVGPYGAEISTFWAELMREAFATSNLRLDVRPSFEYYRPDSAYDPATGVFECEIIIPVAPL